MQGLTLKVRPSAHGLPGCPRRGAGAHRCVPEEGCGGDMPPGCPCPHFSPTCAAASRPSCSMRLTQETMQAHPLAAGQG